MKKCLKKVLTIARSFVSYSCLSRKNEAWRFKRGDTVRVNLISCGWYEDIKVIPYTYLHLKTTWLIKFTLFILQKIISWKRKKLHLQTLWSGLLETQTTLYEWINLTNWRFHSPVSTLYRVDLQYLEMRWNIIQ